MCSESQFESTQKVQSFVRGSLLQWFIIGFLLVTAFCIRLYHINEPLLDFEPIRQYASAHIARGLYYENDDSIPDWKKQVARINLQGERKLEPRIMEHMASFAYRIVGGEHLWIPRLLSSIFWLIGGVFLYLIARKITSLGGALFSTTFYLFLPFAVTGSRTFLAEPMMVMMLIFSIFIILCFYESRSVFRLVMATTVSALAIFVKPMCLFLIFGVFVALAVNREGIWKTIISKELLIFSVASLLPVTAYFFTTGFFEEELEVSTRISFGSYMLLNPSFWKDWMVMIGRVVGYVAFTGSILSVLLFQKGIPRALLTGLWIGYFFFGILFNNRITTHHYYHLQLIPVVAISLGPAGALVMSNLTSWVSTRWRIALPVIFFSVVLSIGFISIYESQWRNLTPDVKRRLEIIGSIIGVNPQFIKFINPDFEEEVRTAGEIAEFVGHSTISVILAYDFGLSLSYHGEFSAVPWPLHIYLDMAKLTGRYISAEERFNLRYIHWNLPEYFIITDFREFERQTDLKDFLYKNFPVMVQEDNYLIFDLRGWAKRHKQL